MGEDIIGGPASSLLPGRIGLMVRLNCREGGRPALLDALHRYVDRLEAEPGTELFAIALDPEDATVVWLQEWFRDESAQRAHSESGPFARLIDDMQDLLASPPGMLRVDPLRFSLQPGILAADLTLEP